MMDSLSNLDRIKLNMISALTQVVIFHTNGDVLESCDTLVKVDAKNSIFSQFDFLKSIEEVFPSLPEGEKLDFDMVEWNEQRSGLFSLSFERLDSTKIQWVIFDKTKEQENIGKVQQARNESAINEEFLEIQRKYLEMEKALLDFKNEELQRVQKFKEQFFAEVSHEMRTPLNSISGLIDLLKSERRDINFDYHAALKATSQHLNAIINDVLDLSKIEAGKFTLSSESFDLHETIDRIISGFTHGATAKGVALEIELGHSVPKNIKGDQVRLSQIIYNLLGNALKFTSSGSVSLSLKAEVANENLFKLNFAIADTGKGMSQEAIQQLLEPYAQVEGQDYLEFGGTGLGLGIAQQLIQLMGGELKIQSELEKGTEMSFELEFEGSKSIEPKPLKSEMLDLSHLNVLFVEDDDIGTVLLKGLARETGIKARFATSIEAFEREITLSTYDRIVSDINLPDGDMISAIGEMRSKKNLNQRTPVIFLSGDDKAMHLGLEELTDWEFLMKPITTTELIELLNTKEVNVNLDNLRASTQGDIGLMKEIIITIIETLPLELEKLNQSVLENDTELSRKVLHKISPSISYLGVPELASLRKELYAAVAKGESIEKGFKAFEELVISALEMLEKEKGKL